MINVWWVVAYFIPYRGVPSEENHVTSGVGWLSIGGSSRIAALPDSTDTTFSVRSSNVPISEANWHVDIRNPQCGRTVVVFVEILTGYGEGETIAEYRPHVVRCDAMIHAGVLPPGTVNTEVRPRGELVVEGHPVFEPFVLWLRIAYEDDMKIARVYPSNFS
jgi:hypothetical protein